jgi:DNA-binding transcriptional regulator YhcF (GntR family)
MKEVIEQILILKSVNTLSKHEQIVNGILNSINENILKKGDALPSINTMIKQLGFARETIAKSYKDLVHSGVIESKNRLGYFVATSKTDQSLKVALVLFGFDIFQETFYKTFQKGLGQNVQLDIFFHHNNFDTFSTIIESIKGKYGMYVIAAIPNAKTKNLLAQLPTNRLLLVDRYIANDEDYSYVVQEFKESSYAAFLGLKDRIKKFDKVFFYFRTQSAEPPEILESFQRFAKEFNIEAAIEKNYQIEHLEKGNVYFTLHGAELWEMLKDAKAKGLEIGKDAGFFSHNDDVIKEILFDGITTFSTDFTAMGKEAAHYVINHKGAKLQKIIPTKLILRNSL